MAAGSIESHLTTARPSSTQEPVSCSFLSAKQLGGSVGAVWRQAGRPSSPGLQEAHGVLLLLFLAPQRPA